MATFGDVARMQSEIDALESMLIGKAVEVVLYGQTVGEQAVSLTTDRLAPGPGNQIKAFADCLSAYEFVVSCIDTTTGQGKTWHINLVAKNLTAATPSVTILSPLTPTVLGRDAGMTGMSFVFIADSTNGSVRLNVTGVAGRTLQWAATGISNGGVSR